MESWLGTECWRAPVSHAYFLLPTVRLPLSTHRIVIPTLPFQHEWIFFIHVLIHSTNKIFTQSLPQAGLVVYKTTLTKISLSEAHSFIHSKWSYYCRKNAEIFHTVLSKLSNTLLMSTEETRLLMVQLLHLCSPLFSAVSSDTYFHILHFSPVADSLFFNCLESFHSENKASITIFYFCSYSLFFPLLFKHPKHV